MDRLSALMSRFALRVQPAPMEIANFFVFRCPAKGMCLCLVPDRVEHRFDAGMDIVFAAHVDWGGPTNPLLSSLLDVLTQPINEELEGIVSLLLREAEMQRCGSASVLNRLGEVLIVGLLREQLSKGDAPVGLMGGLADERISRSIVAIHDQPGHPWRNGQLAEIAGLSPSRFAELFAAKVGETPAAYLRRWRLVLARQDIERGDRVQTVAWRYCYKSSEALARAFRKTFGETPKGRTVSPVNSS